MHQNEHAVSYLPACHMRAFRLIATDKGIFNQPCFNHFHC